MISLVKAFLKSLLASLTPQTPKEHECEAIMTPSKNAEDLIKHWEGCKLEAYQDVAGIWTIGWGSTGPGIREGLTIGQGTADAMLRGHIREMGINLSDLLGREGLLKGSGLKQNEYDALVCFIYNVGLAAFKNSTMFKLLKAGKKQEAAEQFLRWDMAGGKHIPGLHKRREAERALFLA